MRSKLFLKFSIIMPIVILAIWTVTKCSNIFFGQTFQFKISGYDPRDLLSGHYLQFSVNYNVNNICLSVENNHDAYVCLQPLIFLRNKDENCSTFIKGVCRSGRFEAGIEKYFVPEAQASELENKIRHGQAEIQVTVQSSGSAQIKALLVDGVVVSRPLD